MTSPTMTGAKSRLAVTSWSTRTRLLTGMIALTAITLLVAGTVSYVFQRHQLNERLDGSLIRTIEEIRNISKTVDPNTLKPFAEAEDLLYAGMQQTMLGPTQGMIGIGDARVRWKAPVTVDVQLDQDPEFMDWAHRTSVDQIKLDTVKTELRTYRVASVPVQLRSDPEPASFIVAYDYSAEVRQLNTNYLILAGVGMAIMIIAGVVAWLLVGRMLQPIRRLQETAQDISESDVSTRIEVTGRDEFADLTITINQMLDRLENALTAQRQLLDDVGHELRTPVTIIRGHLELMDSTDQADVEQSKDIALDELERMSLLINDIVTLAKANRQDFLIIKPTPVGVLLADVLEKAKALGPRDWKILHRSDATVSLDPARITQAMLQLCDNAVKYSAPDTPVELGSTIKRAPGTPPLLRMWVRDAGTGISEADQQRIFERFGRGSNIARTQGSGLGLNIVTAIVQAHGGSIHLSSTPGRGSAFYLDIPLTPEPRTTEESAS
ncbi:sensor histidine kinase [Micrococcoides hystricis]|uniref:histidine kinase n=2 Tax=Micrococcoides hystricis TaxID=1572761 RepID=A0ABV6PAF2_9MICC